MSTGAPPRGGADAATTAAALPGRLRGRLTGIVDLDDGWDDIALCRDHDPTLFFGPNRFEPKQERLAREAEAIAVCASCPALARCREHALTAGELYGVWGGTTETDRRALLEGDGSVRRAG